MARVIGVESAVLIEQIAFGEETGIDVAVCEVDDGVAGVLDMR